MQFPRRKSPFAARLKYVLWRAKMTQYRLAKLSGLEQSAIGHFVNGRREPSLDSLARMLRAFASVQKYVNCYWFVTGEALI